MKIISGIECSIKSGIVCSLYPGMRCSLLLVSLVRVAVDGGFELDDFHFPGFNIRIAPFRTRKNTTPPIIKSGYFIWVNMARIPARITPLITITSFDVKIILAFICASLLFDR